MPTSIITDQPISYTFTATAGQDTFSCDCQIFNGADDLLVEVDGTETTAFSVELTGDEGFDVILDTPCVGGEEVTVDRIVEVSRGSTAQFPTSGPVSMESLNNELNRLVAMIQQIASANYASITIGTVTTGAPGSSVTVTNVGTSRDAILDISIPAGTPGSAPSLSDAAYGPGWNGDTGNAPSKNAVYDALQLFATLASPVFTGNPQAPLQAPGTSNTRLASCSFVQQELNEGDFRVGIGAGGLERRTTNGPSIGSLETTTNKVMYPSLDFDSATDEFAQATLLMPESWDGGPIKVQFGWYGPSGTPAQNVVWGAQAFHISNNGTLDTAFGTAVTVTDDLGSTTTLQRSSFTGDITVAGSPAGGGLVKLQVYRDADNGSDNLTGDAKLIYIRVQFGIASKDDA